ncbi:MAG: hypothetical protein UHD09_04455, partial [Bifidobacterium sp.]|nr:hypothetical protein [Bifidobacterium sp.]
YDRALAWCHPGAPLVALVWDDEVRGPGDGPLPREAHDVPVDAALTPSGLITLASPRDDAGRAGD